MIYYSFEILEFALDPNLLLHWAQTERDYREFFREYGRGTPRLISSFPKKVFKIKIIFDGKGR